MRPSSLGGGRILCRTLSVRLSVRPSVRPVIITERHVAPPSELQWHTCTLRQRAAYRTAISAAQILVIIDVNKTISVRPRRELNNSSRLFLWGVDQWLIGRLWRVDRRRQRDVL